MERYYRKLVQIVRDDPILVGVVLSALIVFSFVVIVLFIAPPPEPFSEISILMKDPGTGELVAANYPSTAIQNQSVFVYTMVRNFENVPMIYEVKLKLVDPTVPLNNTNGADVPTLKSWIRSVSNGGIWLLNNESSPVEVKFNQTSPGTVRVLFELWKLDSFSSNFMFSQLSVYFHVNVTLSLS